MRGRRNVRVGLGATLGVGLVASLIMAVPLTAAPVAEAAPRDKCAPVTTTTHVPTTVPTTVPVTVTPQPTVDPSSGVTTTPQPYATMSPTRVATTVPKSTTAVPSSCPIVPWRSGWRPKLGAVFNDPMGTYSEKMAIHSRVTAAIKRAPKGATIQIASYTYAFPSVTKALIKAKRRGVHVQMVINGKHTSKDQARLLRVLGSNVRKKSFMARCDGRCRRPGADIGNQHSKVVAISQTGGARYYIMSMSGNFTMKAVSRQWNDSYAVSQDRSLWDAWTKYFGEMAKQKRVRERNIIYHQYTGDVSAYMQRSAAEVANAEGFVSSLETTARTGNKDLVVSRIRNISCAAPRGYGAGGKTVVRISIYAFFGNRGNKIADALASKARQGCNIAVIGSVMGNSVSKRLQAANIRVKAADWLWTERDPDEEDGLGGFGPRYYLHTKAMMVDGVYKKKPTKVVWSSSETWANASRGAEEFTLAVHSNRAYRDYFRYWNNLWTSGAVHKVGIKPEEGPKK